MSNSKWFKTLSQHWSWKVTITSEFPSWSVNRLCLLFVIVDVSITPIKPTCDVRVQKGLKCGELAERTGSLKKNNLFLALAEYFFTKSKHSWLVLWLSLRQRHQRNCNHKNISEGFYFSWSSDHMMNKKAKLYSLDILENVCGRTHPATPLLTCQQTESVSVCARMWVTFVSCCVWGRNYCSGRDIQWHSDIQAFSQELWVYSRPPLQQFPWIKGGQSQAGLKSTEPHVGQ